MTPGVTMLTRVEGPPTLVLEFVTVGKGIPPSPPSFTGNVAFSWLPMLRSYVSGCLLTQPSPMSILANGVA
jgi:hypothetical protein